MDRLDVLQWVGTREPLHVILLAPELVVEAAGVDVTRDSGGWWRHVARWHRARPDVLPGRGAAFRGMKNPRPPEERRGASALGVAFFSLPRCRPQLLLRLFGSRLTRAVGHDGCSDPADGCSADNNDHGRAFSSARRR